jgi:hypothetical protein
MRPSGRYPEVRPIYGARARALILFATFITILASVGFLASNASAGPNAEVAKRCMHYSYLAYPYKRPGSVRMSGDLQAYFRDCMAKEGNVAEPIPAKS